jgi:hypothetical protein
VEKPDRASRIAEKLASAHSCNKHFLLVRRQFRSVAWRREPYMKSALRIPLYLLLAAILPAVGRSQDFSGEVVYSRSLGKHDSQAPAGTAVSAAPPVPIHVSGEMIRFEGGGKNSLDVIVDLANHKTMTLLPEEKLYRAMSESRATGYFRVADAENACPDWQSKVASQIPCEKIGNDVVDGRNTVKYQSVVPNKSVEYVWVDPKLLFVIKWDNGNAGAELRNIKEGPQAADLFVIPKDYGPVLSANKKPAATAKPK